MKFISRAYRIRQGEIGHAICDERSLHAEESITTREAGGLDFLAGGKCRWQENTEALLCFDFELAPGASHPVWARIRAFFNLWIRNRKLFFGKGVRLALIRIVWILAVYEKFVVVQGPCY